jgi:hydroxypyruvate reductase
MAEAVLQLLGTRVTAGAINVKYGHLTPTPLDSRIVVTEAGHPVLDEAGIGGTQQIVKLLESTTARDLVLMLTSGGGSALLEWPVEGVSLADMQALTGALLAAGATINQLNTVRKHLSRVKGGQLARLAAPATLISLVLSDVVGSPLDVISSGPTVPDTSTFAQAWSILQSFNLTTPDKIPSPVLQHLKQGVAGEVAETPKDGDPIFAKVQTVIVADNRIAALAAQAKAQELGFNSILLTTFLEGEAREVARAIAGVAREIIAFNSPLARPACILAGGETTVTIRGNGLGGRNQEMALAAALAIAGLEKVVIVPLATDGTDGPTDVAGAIVDGTTVARALAAHLDPFDYLTRNDSYHFFEQLGDLLKTGPTNTNVNDLLLLLVY